MGVQCGAVETRKEIHIPWGEDLMRWLRVGTVVLLLAMAFSLGGGLRVAKAQDSGAAKRPETGYAVKKPVFGGACAECPWGAMAEIVKAMLSPYGWDVQICYSCAGGPRESRLVATAAPAKPANPTADTPPTPKGPVDFGTTGVEYLESLYLGTN